MTPIKMSRRAYKEADRMRGCVYMLPWPAGLPAPERGRSKPMPVETRTACELLAEFSGAGIVLHEIGIAWAQDRRLGPDKAGRELRPYLTVYAVTTRWPQELHTADPNPRRVWL